MDILIYGYTENSYLQFVESYYYEKILQYVQFSEVNTHDLSEFYGFKTYFVINPQRCRVIAVRDI